MSSVQSPVEWRGKFVSTLDALEFMRQYEARTGSLLVFLGSEDVRRFASFLDGLTFHLFLCGVSNPGFGALLDWLRVRHGLSSGPWEEKFLADAGGDHKAAIRQFLDEVGAFRAAHPGLGTTGISPASGDGGT